MDIEKKDSAFVNGARRTQDGRDPFIDVVTFRTGTKITKLNVLKKP